MVRMVIGDILRRFEEKKTKVSNRIQIINLLAQQSLGNAIYLTSGSTSSLLPKDFPLSGSQWALENLKEVDNNQLQLRLKPIQLNSRPTV